MSFKVLQPVQRVEIAQQIVPCNEIAPQIIVPDIHTNNEELWGDNGDDDELLSFLADGAESSYLCDNPGKIYF
jgi:hypothetical protein